MLFGVVTGVELTIAHQHVIVDILRWLTILSFGQRHTGGISIRTSVGEQSGPRKVKETAALTPAALADAYYLGLVDKTGGTAAAGQRDVTELHGNKTGVAAQCEGAE